MVTLKLAVLILPGFLCGQSLHYVPMLRNLTILDTEEIIVGGRYAAECSLADSQTVVAIGQNIVRLMVDHLNPLFGKGGQCSAKTGKTVSNAGVVLDIIVTVEVVGQLAGILTAKHVTNECSNDFAGLFLIDFLLFQSAVDLRVAGWIRISLGGKVIPMLSDLTVSIHTENVKCDLLTHTDEIVNGLQKHLVAVLERTDVVDGGFHRSGAKVGNAADKSVRTGTIGEVMLDVAGSQKFLRLLSIAG